MYVSTTTLAGRALAEEKLAGLADGVFFAPLDYRSVVRRGPAAIAAGTGGGARNRNLAESVSRIETRGRVPADRERPNL